MVYDIKVWLRRGLLTIAALATSACGTLSDRLGSVSRVDPHTVAAYHSDQDDYYNDKEGQIYCPMVKPYNDFNYGAINLDCYRFPDATQDSDGSHSRPAVETAYAAAVKDKGARNRLALVLIKNSNNICTLEMGRFTSRNATFNAGLGITTTALAGVSTIVTGVLAKSILSGGATIVSGARDHINAEVYQSQVAQAISHAITIERDRRYVEITGKFRQSLQDWPIDMAILDVDAFHSQCSFYRGLDLVVSAVDKSEKPKPVPVPVDSFAAAIKDFNDRIAQNVKELGTPVTPKRQTELVKENKSLKTSVEMMTKAQERESKKVASGD